MKFIYINESGELLLIEASEKPVYYDFSASSAGDSSYEQKLEHYEEALQEAIANGVRFKDQDATHEIIYEWPLAKNNMHEIPSGYTVEVELGKCEVWCGGAGCVPFKGNKEKCSGSPSKKLAILKPSQEPKEELPQSDHPLSLEDIIRKQPQGFSLKQHECVVDAMKEYASLQKQQETERIIQKDELIASLRRNSIAASNLLARARDEKISLEQDVRNRTVQECIDIVIWKMNDMEDFKSVIEFLEKLKTK